MTALSYCEAKYQNICCEYEAKHDCAAAIEAMTMEEAIQAGRSGGMERWGGGGDEGGEKMK